MTNGTRSLPLIMSQISGPSTRQHIFRGARESHVCFSKATSSQIYVRYVCYVKNVTTPHWTTSCNYFEFNLSDLQTTASCKQNVFKCIAHQCRRKGRYYYGGRTTMIACVEGGREEGQTSRRRWTHLTDRPQSQPHARPKRRLFSRTHPSADSIPTETRGWERRK